MVPNPKVVQPMQRRLWISVVLAVGCLGGQTVSGQKLARSAGKEVPMSIQVTSTAFEAGAMVPRRHTGDGEDQSPPLAWNNLPEGTQELALVCDDPDAPTPKPWVHWVIYGMAAETEGLPAGVKAGKNPTAPRGSVQGANSWKTIGYRGPAPPRGHGTHHYHFTLYALDQPLKLKAGLDKDALLKAIDGHVLAKGELIGTYERK